MFVWKIVFELWCVWSAEFKVLKPSSLLSTSHQLPYQRRQPDRRAWWRGRNHWTSRTGTGRRLVDDSWRPRGRPLFGRTHPQSEQTASRSISPRLRLDFEKLGSGGWRVSLLSRSNYFQTSLFLDCYSLLPLSICCPISIAILRAHHQRHRSVGCANPPSPIARISVSREVCLTRVRRVSPMVFWSSWHPNLHTRINVLDGCVCSFSAFAKCHFKKCSFEKPTSNQALS